MLDVINNALKNNDYYIVLYNNKTYIYNYQEIISFSSVLIVIRLNTQVIIKVTGKDLLIIKMVYKELLINGNIESVKYD